LGKNFLHPKNNALPYTYVPKPKKAFPHQKNVWERRFHPTAPLDITILNTIMTSSICNQPWHATFLLRSAVLPQAFLQNSPDLQKNSLDMKKYRYIKNFCVEVNSCPWNHLFMSFIA